MPHLHWLHKKPKDGAVGPSQVRSLLPSANTGKASHGAGNSSVLSPSTLPVRAAGSSSAVSVTSTTSQDLNANNPETGTMAFADDEPKDLWDRAYTALRERKDLKKLMDTYERVLLENIHGEDTSTGTFASFKASEREEQMSRLVQKKVDDMEAKHTKLRLGGKEMEVRPQFDRVVKGVVFAKEFVTSAASGEPHAALAWAGVCIFLPLLLNPSKQQEALEEGLGHISDLVFRFTVIERMYIEQKVSRPDSSCPEDIKRLRQSLEVRITTLYSEILEYQVRVVCHPDHKLVKLGRDMIAVDGWVEMLVKIKKSELSCEEFMQVLGSEKLDHTFKVQNRHMKEHFNKVAEATATASKARSEEHRTDEEINCHRVFRTSEYEAQKNRNPNRVKDTCNWFLQHPIYKNWRDEDKDRLLWVSADPGCGKSVLSRSLIDKEFHDMDSYTLCYFFFKDDNENQNSAKNALCSVLHQLFGKRPHLLKHSLPEFRNNGDKLPGLFDPLWTIFTSIAADPEAGNIICVLDALDECEEPHRTDLVNKLNELYQHTTDNSPKKTELKILVTSRPYEDIENVFDPLTIRLAGEEESDAIRQEIDLVIKDKVPTIAKKLRVETMAWFQPYLEQKLTSIPHRTYLWLHLILEGIILRQGHLRAGITKKNLEAMIDSIPGTVEAAYNDILEKSTDRDLAKKLLHIVVAAKRPLTLGEMNIAMNVMDGSRSYEDLGLEPEDRSKVTIRSLCGLFVSVIDSKIYLLHQTAKEFLITKSNAAESSIGVQPQSEVWKHSLEPGESNFVLAKSCISYLLFSVFEEDPLVLDKNIEKKDGKDEKDEGDEGYEKYQKKEEITRLYCEEHKFLNYSSLYWTTHFREAGGFDEASLDKALSICGTGTKRLRTWLTVDPWLWDIYEISEMSQMTDLMIASHFKLLLLVQLLLDRGADPSATDEDGRTALHEAAFGDNEILIRLLLDRGADPSATDKYGCTALRLATSKGHEIVIRLLLDRGADPSATDEDGRTALHKAAFGDNEILIRLLLDRGADPSATDKHGSTALHLAAFCGKEILIRLLLDRGADPSAIKNDGETALDAARHSDLRKFSESAYEAIIQLLEPITKPTATPTDGSRSSIPRPSSSHSLSKPSQVESD